jgi:uncharacterized protein with PQ loop repeat
MYGPSSNNNHYQYFWQAFLGFFMFVSQILVSLREEFSLNLSWCFHIFLIIGFLYFLTYGI